ncbi:polysaccharide export outer membrane protein [Polaribacter sp. Hel1_33_49]|nr:polysaccharide export outer membrane protein [Polaribacter sp. Hel1_33_49]
MSKFKIIFLPFTLLFFLSSCVSKKDLIYLQYDEIDQSKVSNDYQLTFKPDDLLQIIISSKDVKAALPFNLPVLASSPSAISAQGIPKLQSYLIDGKGEVEFPVLGVLKLGGLTRIEAIDLLKDKLHPNYLKDPIVNIIITNFKVTVIGDVRNSRVFQVENERVTIFDAIGMAGDLNISGVRENVTVIREEFNKKNKYVIDLRSNNIMTSPVYYLQQNDLIYIEQNTSRIQDAAYTRSTGLFISLASVLISLITVITR